MKRPLQECEIWLYNCNELETYSGKCNYVDLVSLNFTTKYLKRDILTLVDK